MELLHFDKFEVYCQARCVFCWNNEEAVIYSCRVKLRSKREMMVSYCDWLRESGRCALLQMMCPIMPRPRRTEEMRRRLAAVSIRIDTKKESG